MKLIAVLVFTSIFAIAYSEELLCTGEHEHLSQTTPACPLTCATYGKAHCLALILKPSCQCTDGTVRDLSTNKCVKHEDCPKPENAELLCNGENEHLSQTTPCHVPTCQNSHRLMTCMSIILEPSCQCNVGYIRDATSSKCVAKEQCPQ